MASRMYAERGGQKGPVMLLLHGLGGSGANWAPFLQALESRWAGAWITVDLPGHGDSAPVDAPTFDALAARVSEEVGASEVVAVGHSLGGMVALALSSGRWETQVSHAVLIGPKLRWSEEDVATSRRRASQSARHFNTADQALEYAKRVAGLPADAAENSLRRLVVAEPSGFRLAMHPAASPTARITGSPEQFFDQIRRASQARIITTAGEHDPAVTLDELREFDQEAVLIPGTGHSPHVARPHEVLDVVLPRLD